MATPRTRKGRLIGLLGIPIFALAAFAIATALPYLSSRFAHMELPSCARGPDVPWWNINAWRKWCVVAQREGPGSAYAFAGLHLRVNGHPCAALRMFERGAELNDGESYVWMGAIHIRGECGPADFPRALAAFETAVTLREYLAQGWLEQIYEGKFGRTLRDPEKAAMWAFASVLLHNQRPANARDYGRRLGLSEAQIDEAHERMRRWLLERKVLKE